MQKRCRSFLINWRLLIKRLKKTTELYLIDANTIQLINRIGSHSIYRVINCRFCPIKTYFMTNSTPDNRWMDFCHFGKYNN